jgi:MFS family permease
MVGDNLNLVNRGRRFLEREFGFHRIVWILFWGNLISAVGRFMMRPFMALYLGDRLGVPVSAIGWYIGVSSLAGVFSGFIAGTLADRFGRKSLMAVSLIVDAMVIAAYTTTNSLSTFSLLFVLHGAVTPLFFPASSATIADVTSSERRAQAYGLVRIAVNVGAVLGPPIGAILVLRSYNVAFLITAATTFLFGLIVLVLVPETKPAAMVHSNTREQGYGEVLKDGFFMLFVLLGILVGTSYSQLETTLPLFLKAERGMSEYHYGYLMALNGFLVVTLQIPVTWAVNRFRTSQALALSSLLYAIGFGAYAYLARFDAMMVAMVIVTFGEMVSSPSYSKFVADIAPVNLRGRYMAMSALPWAISGIIGPPLGSTLMGGLGGASVWRLAAGLCFVSAALYLTLDQRNRHRRHAANPPGR